PSKSPFSGTSVAAAISRKWASIMPRGTLPSGMPWVKANPALVVASALNPNPCRYRAEPTSQGLGMTKHPSAWSLRNVARFSAGVGMGSLFAIGGVGEGGCLITSALCWLDGGPRTFQPKELDGEGIGLDGRHWLLSFAY